MRTNRFGQVFTDKTKSQHSGAFNFTSSGFGSLFRELAFQLPNWLLRKRSSFALFSKQALPYMTDVPAALRHWHSLLKPGGRLAFNCWAEQSYVTGHLLREIAARHGIRVAVIRRDTGTPDRCRSILGAAGFVETKVVVEPTSTFFLAEPWNRR